MCDFFRKLGQDAAGVAHLAYCSTARKALGDWVVLSPHSPCQADVPHLLEIAPDKPQTVFHLDRDDEAMGVRDIGCEKPYCFNSGQHRTMIWVDDYKGESYVLAVEEASELSENLFIAARSEGGKELLEDISEKEANALAVDILKAAVFALKGIRLNPKAHNFIVIVDYDAEALEEELCKPSPDMYGL